MMANVYFLIAGLLLAFVSNTVGDGWIAHVLIYPAASCLLLSLLLSMPVFKELLNNKETHKRAVQIAVTAVATLISYQFTIICAVDGEWNLAVAGSLLFLGVGAQLIRLLSRPKLK